MPVQQPIEPIHADLVRYFEERDSLALDKDDLAAMRSANDHVGLFWVTGLGYMRVTKRGTEQGGYRLPSVDRYIPIRTEFSLHSRTEKPGFCVEVIHTSSGDECRQWRTIAGSLRVGDMLTVRWVPDNTSQAMDARGESSDECWLEVWPQGNNEKRRVYLIDKWHGPVNDRWRMCRRSENQ